MRIMFLQSDVIQAEITEIAKDISSDFNTTSPCVREHEERYEIFIGVNRDFVSFY